MMKMYHLFAILILIILPATAVLGYTYIHPKPFQGVIREVDIGTADNRIKMNDENKLKKVDAMLDELKLTMKFPQTTEVKDLLRLRIKFQDRSYNIGLSSGQMIIDGKIYRTNKDIKPRLLALVPE